MVPFSAVLLFNVNPYVKCLIISCLKDVSVCDNFILCDGNEVHYGPAGEIVSLLMMLRKTTMKVGEALLLVADASLFAGTNEILVVSKFKDLDKYQFDLIKNKFERQLNFTYIEPDNLPKYLKGHYERKNVS